MATYYVNLVTGTQIDIDKTLTFSNSDALNTQKTTTFTKPTEVKKKYALIIKNPSTITDLTVKVFNVEATLGDILIENFVIPKSQSIIGTTISAYEVLLEGCFISTDLKVVISNNTVLGVSDGFNTTIRLIEVA